MSLSTSASELTASSPQKKFVATQALLNEKKRVFRTGDQAELKLVQRQLKQRLKHSKDSYKRKLEEKLQSNKARDIGIKWDERDHWLPEEEQECSCEESGAGK